MNKAVFFDRDGVINEVLLHQGLPTSPHSRGPFRICAGIPEAMQRLKKAGYLVLVATNQPDLVRGKITWEGLNDLHHYMRAQLPWIDDLLICPHDDADGCDCRKPKPGLLLDAARHWVIDLKHSFMIGDTWRDLGAGQVAGCYTVLVDTPYNQGLIPDLRISDRYELAQEILAFSAKVF